MGSKIKLIPPQTGAGTTDHNELFNRDAPNQHPWESITKPDGGIKETELEQAVQDKLALLNNMADPHWKAPVSTYNSLPQFDNGDGDTRIVLSEEAIYQWDDQTGQWIKVGNTSSNNIHIIPNRASLPSPGQKDHFYVVVADELRSNNASTFVYDGMTYKIAGDGGSGGGGGSDPELENRVTILEEQLSSEVMTYQEDFLNNSLIDFDSTTAIVGTGYVKVGKTAQFVEEFDDTNHIDLPNSTNIAVNDGKITMTNALMALLKTKPFATQGTLHARVDPIINHYSANAFSHTEEIANKGSESKSLRSTAVIDRDGKLWQFYGGNDTLYCKVYNADGSIYLDEFTVAGAQCSWTHQRQRMRAVVDYNNRVWLTYHRLDNYFYITSFNNDGSIFLNQTLIGSSSIALGSDMFVDRNNRIWVTYKVNTGNSSSRAKYVIYNSDGSIYRPLGDLDANASFGGSGLSIVYHPATDRILIFGGGYYTDSNSTSIGVVRLDITGVIVNAYTALTGGSALNDGFRAFYDEDSDEIVCIYGGVNNILTIKRVAPSTLAHIATVSTGITLASFRSIDAIKQGGNYSIVFESNADSTTYTNIHFVTIDKNGNIIESEIAVTSSLAYNNTIPTIYLFNGVLRVQYSTNRLSATYTVIDEARYVLTPTTARYFLSNNGGAEWIEAQPGQAVDFPSVGTSLVMKIEFTSPYTTMTPELLRYTLTEWGSSNEYTHGELITSKLPSVSPVVKAILTAVQELNGGTITWFLSNTGGREWYPVELGQTFVFPNTLGSDIRVKAVIESPEGEEVSPKISQFTVVTSAIVPQSRFTDLEINLMKTNFKLDSFTNASRNGMKNMVIDVFNDDSGIDKAKTTALFDSSRKLFRDSVDVLRDMSGGTLVGNVYTSPLGDKWTFPNNPSARMFNNTDLDASYWHGGGSGAYTHTLQLADAMKLAKFRAIYKRPDNGSYAMKATVSVSLDSTDGNNGSWTTIGVIDFSAEEGILSVEPIWARWVKVVFANVIDAWTACSEFQIWQTVEGSSELVSKIENTVIPPNNILLTVDEALNDGSISYQASRDGGSNWVDIIPNIVSDLRGTPEGTSLVCKAVLTGGSFLTAWAYAWN